MSAALPVRIKRLAHAQGLPLPAYATAGSVGADLLAAISAPALIEPGARLMVPTGIAVALPEGYEAQVRPRSGLAVRHGVTVLNSPGTIDSDYRGEISVILINLGRRPYTIRRGQAIAQMVVAPAVRIGWREADELPPSARGSGGFGSTSAGGGG